MTDRRGCPTSSSSDDEEEDVEVLDSVAKIDSALEHAPLSPTASLEANSGDVGGVDDSSNQRDLSADNSAAIEGKWDELRRTNDHLRNEVADLTSALLARDLELVRLRERCQFLTAAVDRQDEVIAKIYAATASATPTKGSPFSTSPILTGKDEHRTLADVGGEGLCSLSNSTKEQKQNKLFGNVKSFPGAMTIADPAQMMLEAHLDSMGFECDRVEEVVESLAEELPTELKTSSGDIVNVALDQLLYPPHVPDPVSKPPRSWSSPRSSAFTKRRPSLDRQDSATSEESFARSAGFLRKSNRKLSGRLSVSDLGLLKNDEEDNEDNQSPQTTPPSSQDPLDKSDLDDGTEFADTGNSTLSMRSRSQRNLFADVDDAIKAKKNLKNRDSDPVGGDKEDEDELTYGEFLQRISLPASRDILDKIRMFVGSILGPRGDGRPPRSTDYVEYDFYGKHEFRRRCERFFQNMEDLLLNHPAWRHASETKLAKARDGIEKYVMDKVADIAFNQLKECQQWKQEDEALLRRMQLLSFVTPAMLDIKPCMRNEVVWSMAEDELRRINSFRSPGDKINCIVRCCSVIFSVLNLSRGDSGSRPGADDFLPVFIYIVLHSQIPRLHSNCEYISAYRNQADLMSK
ncbi:hypothetical protein BBJ28_00021490 [Nothophytophthora sp. Chile5]|nr:hypothetical protein BBJ28_00021490 [Nothophytophthora sp. Chile5]